MTRQLIIDTFDCPTENNEKKCDKVTHENQCLKSDFSSEWGRAGSVFAVCALAHKPMEIVHLKNCK